METPYSVEFEFMGLIYGFRVMDLKLRVECYLGGQGDYG